MDTRQLRSFLAVAFYLNFTEAAKHLFLAQSTLSRQIVELEKELGAALFIRNNRIVSLTPAGHLLQKEADLLIRKIDGLIVQIGQLNDGSLGTLKIGCLGVEKYFLPELIKAFSAKHPQIQLQVDWFGIQKLKQALTSKVIDIGFSLASEIENIPHLACQTIYTDTLAAVIPIDHPLANKSSLHLSDLAAESFVIMSKEEVPNSFDFITGLCMNKGFSMKIVKEATSLEDLFLSVELGLGISVISSKMQSNSHSRLHFIPLSDEDAFVQVVVSWNKQNQNPLVPLLLQELETFL
jgi:DNA-binding transcriptional LysR family regulator